MSARAIGSGTVSFGLVSIPVKVYSASENSNSIRFNMLEAATGSRVKQQYISVETGEVVPRADMVKGYEFSKGQYVMLTEDEYKSLQEVANNSIELTEFVRSDAVDPVYFDKTYYLGPDKGGDRAYALLREALTETGLVGIAKYAARGRQNLVMVRSVEATAEHKGGLVLHQLRYADEVKSFAEVPLDGAAPASEGELKLAKQLIDQIASKTFDPTKYRDEVKDRILELIQQKIDGEEITEAPEVAPQGQIIDLMEALKASLGENQPAAKPKAKSAKAKPAKDKKTKAAKDKKAKG